jgi:Ankyrin repeats (3 copies)
MMLSMKRTMMLSMKHSVTLQKNGHSTWHVEVCRLLCAQVRNSSPRLVDKYAMNDTGDDDPGPLHLAARNGRVNIARMLVEEYSSIFNVNQETDRFYGYEHVQTPLQYAVSIDDRTNRHEMCRVLLEHGADPNQDPNAVDGTNSTGVSALFPAVSAGDRVLVRLLLQYGANPGLIPDGAGEYYEEDLSYVQTAISDVSDPEMLADLLDHGARVGVQSGYEESRFSGHAL